MVTHHHIHNGPSHLQSCRYNLFLNVSPFSLHIRLLLNDAFPVKALSESNATVVPQLPRNVEEAQLRNLQLFLYRGLWVQSSWLKVDRMTGDLDTNPHPSHISDGISKVLLFLASSPVCLINIFMSMFLWSLKTLSCQHHVLVYWRLWGSISCWRRRKAIFLTFPTTFASLKWKMKYFFHIWIAYQIPSIFVNW